MGATIAGRAWRLSALLNNPVMSMGTGSTGHMSRVEKVRKIILQALTSLSGCKFSALSLTRKNSNGAGRPIRIQISFGQMMRAISVILLPQVLLQLVVLAVPALRATQQMSYFTSNEMTFGEYECRSLSVGPWPIYLVVSVLLGILPYCCAYILNIRPKYELDQFPDIVFERDDLELTFFMFVRVVVITSPIIGLAIAPDVRAYATIALVLSLPLSLCSYTKLASLKSNITRQGRLAPSYGKAGDDGGSRSSAALAVNMAMMYQKIGRAEETIQLVDETLEVWKKSGKGAITNLGQREGREEIGSGFTRCDLKPLEPEELELIIELLKIKGNALRALHGQAGVAMSAQLNVDSLKIFENCPAASKLRDTSIIFPVSDIIL
mmetsp:Transcript_30873/g.46821  ORF Transcript_30873/g.46821 Transcript_30873/m.46821 type:complete len:380 (-) Transcript_30873:1307-2446(-)